MGGGKSVGNAGEHLDGLAPVVVRAHPVAERPPVDELGDEVLPAVDLTRVVHRQDVRMIQGRSGLGFPLKAAARRAVGNGR
jgi:hypothetical protein